jgi:hypothetical protein
MQPPQKGLSSADMQLPSLPSRKFPPALDIMIGAALAFLVMAVARGLQPSLIGLLNDDANYMLFAKALATGQGYVNMHYPNNPPAARFPIGFPALLAAVIYGAGSIQAEVARAMWVPIVSLGLFIGTCYWYFRSRAHLPVWLALPLTLCLPFTWTVLQLSFSIMTDMLFALFGLLCILWMEHLWRREGGTASWKPWLAVGLFIGVTCLFRYAGGTLLMALILTCLAARKWKPMVSATAGFGLVFGAWLLFRTLTGGGESYIAEYSQRLPDVAAMIVALQDATTPLLAQSLPGLFVPQLARDRHVLGLVGGTLMAIIVLFGTLRWFRSPRPWETPLPAAYLIVSLPLMLLWQLSFLYLGSDLLSRLLIPITPFVFLAFGRGVQELAAMITTRALPWNAIAAVGLVPVLLAHLANFQFIQQGTPQREQIYFGQGAHDVLDWLKNNTPPDALLAGWNPPTLTYYTGRKCIPLGIVYGTDTVAMLKMILKWRPSYVVGWPALRPEATGLVDRTMVQINDFQKEVPEVLDPVFVSKDARYVVFKVDYPTLNKQIDEAQAAQRKRANGPATEPPAVPRP